jgi:predicted ferric reductase
MSNVVGAFLAAPGMSLLLCARDARWSAWRIIVQHQVVAIVSILFAAFWLMGSPNNLQPSNPLAWTFIGIMVLFLGALLLLLVRMERRRIMKASTATGGRVQQS